LCHAPSSEIPPTIPSSLDPNFVDLFSFGRINLLMRANRVIDVIAVTTAKGDYYMATSTTEDRTAHITGAERAKLSKKARVARTRAHVAPKRAKSAPKAKALKNAPKGAKKEGSARDGSKTAKVLDLLKRYEGASMKELLKATGWQPHSVRGFLSGAVRKKMELTVTSTKAEDGERTYSVKS
jgi:hypothetical protein